MAENGSPSKDINRDEATFLAEVIKNMDEQRSVDLAKVAEALGYTSVGSVANRFRLLKKKYDLKLSGRQGPLKSSATAADAASGESTTTTDNNAPADDENQVDSSAAAPASATPSPAKPGRRPRAANPRPRKGAKPSTDKPIPATKGMDTTATPAAQVKVAGKTANLPAHRYPEHPGIHPALLLAVEIALWEREREKQARAAAKVNVSQAPSANDDKDEVDDDA